MTDIPIPQAELEALSSSLGVKSFTEDVDIIDAAMEMAAPGLTAEREAEIAAALPRQYTERVNATAQESDDKIRVPKILIVNCVLVKQGPQASDEWQTGVSGRRQRRPKENVALGYHVLVDNEWATVVKLLYLWSPQKG